MLDCKPMNDKRFIAEEDLLNDAFRLGVKVFNDGFRPTFVVGLWRGGSTIGIYVQECLQYLGVDTNHISVRTSYAGVASYRDMVENPSDNIRVHGTQYLLENLNAEDKLLLVDDVYGSGLTLDVVLKRLRKRLKRNMPRDTRIATVFNREADNVTGTRPDYYIHDCDAWLVLPYELSGLSDDEIRQHKPQVAKLLAQACNA